MNKKNDKRPDSSVVAKAGLWYTVCNFLFKGVHFITTPIFARLLTKAELGTFSDYSSWISILAVVTAFDLHTSIIRSKLEHEDDIDSYVWSILSFTSIATLIIYVIVCIFQEFFVALFSVDMKYIHIMFIYLLLSPAYFMLITKQRAFYKYKNFIALTGMLTLSSTFISLALVLLMENKLAGRIIGSYFPQIAISAVIYVYLAFQGKRIKLKYWKYACIICMPLVPHVLSLYLLSSSDKLIITRLCGSEFTAIYSIAYSCYHIVTILFDSMNKAWAPWLLDSLHHKEYEEIKRISKVYILVFAAIAVGVLLVSPEVVLILGGKQYMMAAYCLPPLVASCAFQFVYTMYVNIEFYEKRTIGVAGATMIATALNIVLNFIFIPMNKGYGYIIAAYTTLAGYIVLFVLHYYLVKKLKMDHVYSIRFNIEVLLVILVISIVMNFLYRGYALRYVITLFYSMMIVGVVSKNKSMILNLLKKK